MIIFIFIRIFRNIWLWPFTILTSIIDSLIWKSSLTSCWLSRVQSSILINSTLTRTLFISWHCCPISSHSINSWMTSISGRILLSTIRRLKSFNSWLLGLYAVTATFYRFFTLYWRRSHHITNLISSHSVLIA